MIYSLLRMRSAAILLRMENTSRLTNSERAVTSAFRLARTIPTRLRPPSPPSKSSLFIPAPTPKRQNASPSMRLWRSRPINLSGYRSNLQIISVFRLKFAGLGIGLLGEANGNLFPMVDQCRRAVAWVYRNAATFGGNPDPKFPWTNRTVSTVRLSYDQSGLLVRSKCLIAVLLYLQSPSDSKLSQAHSSRRERRVHRENVSHRLLRRSQASQLVTDPLNGPSNFARLSRRVERAHSSCESAGLH